jgi:hypothetical protein
MEHLISLIVVLRFISDNPLVVKEINRLLNRERSQGILISSGHISISLDEGWCWKNNGGKVFWFNFNFNSPFFETWLVEKIF